MPDELEGFPPETELPLGLPPRLPDTDQDEAPAEWVAAGAAALHEAGCADEQCWREGHANFRSQPDEEIARCVLEGVAHLVQPVVPDGFIVVGRSDQRVVLAAAHVFVGHTAEFRRCAEAAGLTR